MTFVGILQSNGTADLHIAAANRLDGVNALPAGAAANRLRLPLPSTYRTLSFEMSPWPVSKWARGDRFGRSRNEL